MKFNCKIIAKNFKEKVLLDDITELDFEGINPIRFDNSVMLDIKQFMFEKNRIVLDCIYVEGMTAYCRCSLILTQNV